jgi:hypothetical protein
VGGKVILFIVVLLLAVLVASWALGELLRQRKPPRR